MRLTPSRRSPCRRGTSGCPAGTGATLAYTPHAHGSTLPVKWSWLAAQPAPRRAGSRAAHGRVPTDVGSPRAERADALASHAWVQPRCGATQRDGGRGPERSPRAGGPSPRAAPRRGSTLQPCVHGPPARSRGPPVPRQRGLGAFLLEPPRTPHGRAWADGDRAGRGVPRTIDLAEPYQFAFQGVSAALLLPLPHSERGSRWEPLPVKDVHQKLLKSK